MFSRMTRGFNFIRGLSRPAAMMGFHGINLGIRAGRLGMRGARLGGRIGLGTAREVGIMGRHMGGYAIRNPLRTGLMAGGAYAGWKVGGAVAGAAGWTGRTAYRFGRYGAE